MMLMTHRLIGNEITRYTTHWLSHRVFLSINVDMICPCFYSPCMYIHCLFFLTWCILTDPSCPDNWTEIREKSRIIHKGWCISNEFCHKRLLFIIKFKLNTNLYQIKIFLDRIYGFIQMIKSLVRIIRVRATRRGVEAAKQGTCFE